MWLMPDACQIDWAARDEACETRAQGDVAGVVDGVGHVVLVAHARNLPIGVRSGRKN